jgi:hypothetical protein
MLNLIKKSEQSERLKKLKMHFLMLHLLKKNIKNNQNTYENFQNKMKQNVIENRTRLNHYFMNYPIICTISILLLF